MRTRMRRRRTTGQGRGRRRGREQGLGRFQGVGGRGRSRGHGRGRGWGQREGKGWGQGWGRGRVRGRWQFSSLSGLSGLKTIFFQQTWNLADLDYSVSPFSWAKSELAISVLHPLNFLLAVPNYGHTVSWGQWSWTSPLKQDIFETPSTSLTTHELQLIVI